MILHLVMTIALIPGTFGVVYAQDNTQENKCGLPDGGGKIICSTNVTGNIVYELTDDNNYEIHIDVPSPGIAYSHPYPPTESRTEIPLAELSATRIEKRGNGNLSFFSSSDVTSNVRGISIAHFGTGALRTEIDGGNFRINSAWQRGFAIHSWTGYEDPENVPNVRNKVPHDLIVRNADIDVRDGPWGGIVGVQNAMGDLSIDVKDTKIKVSDTHWATGIIGIHRDVGRLNVNVSGANIDVNGPGPVDGIYGFHTGEGDTFITVQDTKIKVDVPDRKASGGITFYYWDPEGGTNKGNLNIKAKDVDIEVDGWFIDGIWGGHWGEGDISISVDQAKIVTTGDDSGGMSFIHDQKGDISIIAREVDIEVLGDRSVGIGGGQRYAASGDVTIDVHDSTILAEGEQIAGIRSFIFSGQGKIDIKVNGGDIMAKGPGSSGILVGLTGRVFGTRTGPIPAPAVRQTEEGDNSEIEITSGDTKRGASQSVFVNGNVWGGDIKPGQDNPVSEPVVGAGVRVYGGGEVIIGPQGTVGADSGVAIRAEGPKETNPLLQVDLQFAGRRVDDVLKGNISNELGRTEIKVNGQVIHSPIEGTYENLKVPNGARDISLRSSETILGREFLPTDFSDPYAPRAAIYESMPGFLFELNSRVTDQQQSLDPEKPGWFKFGGSMGSYLAARSQVGSKYGYHSFEADVGVGFPLFGSENISGWFSLRQKSGSADVKSSYGGGQIKADGQGLVFGSNWESDAGYQVKAVASYTRYDLELVSSRRGLLKEDTGARVLALGVEAGRRIPISDKRILMPLAWFDHSEVSIDGFEDSVGSQVSSNKSKRSILGIGVVRETTHHFDNTDGQLDLRIRAGLESVLGDIESITTVSGENLVSAPASTKGVLKIGAKYISKKLVVNGAISASGLGTKERGYRGNLHFEMSF